MSDKELKEKYEKIFKDDEVFSFKDLMNVNQQPHTFMIGPKHVTHAADNHGGMLGKETTNKIPCAMKGCDLMYDDHTKGDKVLFLQLKRDATNDEANEIIQPLAEGLKADGIDGLTFIETEEKYRIS